MIGTVIERPKQSAKRARQALIIEVSGLASLTVGLGLLRIWLGLVAAGVAMVAVGLAMERQ